MGLHFEKIPFRDVYIHALVARRARRQMSKSKGNVSIRGRSATITDADASRSTLAAMAAQGAHQARGRTLEAQQFRDKL